MNPILKWFYLVYNCYFEDGRYCDLLTSPWELFILAVIIALVCFHAWMAGRILKLIEDK